MKRSVLLLWAIPRIALADGPSVEVEIPAMQTSPVQWDLTLDTALRWQLDDGNVTGPTDRNWDPVAEDFRDWTATIGGSIRWKRFQASVRIDTAVYGNESVAAPDASQIVKSSAANRYQDTIRLEYISGVYAKGRDSVTLGDFYVTLGRGMILAVRKVSDVGVDNKLRGAMFRLNPAGDLTLQAFGGVLNIKNFEQGTGYVYPEEDDLVGGARAEYSFGKYLRIGVHGMTYRRFGLEGGDENENYGYGGTIELPRPVSWASVYLEAGALSRRLIEDGTETDRSGYGLYGSTNLYLGPATVLVEGKLYDDLFQLLPGARLTSVDGRQLINRLQEPPTAEPAQSIILTNRSVGGGRARIDYRIDPSVVPYVSFGRYRDFDGSVPSDITSVFAGSRFSWSGGHATVTGGFRGDYLDQSELPIRDQFEEPLLTRDVHWIADISQEIVSDYSLELFASGRYAAEQAGSVPCTAADALDAGRVCDVNEGTGAGIIRTTEGRQIRDLTDWVEGRVALSFSSSGGWSVTGAWEFYTKSPDTFRPYYFSIGGQWEFMEGSVVRALVGQERAGLKCSGGACRFFPGFEGGRLELSMRI